METTKTAIGIEKDNRKSVVDMLKQLLADEYVLYTKYRNAHWNVEGVDFHSKHVFFEEEYGKLENTLDSLRNTFKNWFLLKMLKIKFIIKFLF